MKRQHLLLGGLLLAVLVAAGALLFPRLFKQVTEDLPLPPTGEAAYNPLYALKLALLAHGQKVSSWPNLAAAEHALGASDTLLLFDRPETMGNAQAQRLMTWVQGGGHLLMPGPPDEAAAGPLAGALGLRAVKEPEAKAQIQQRTQATRYAGCVHLLAPGQPVSIERGTWLCEPPFLPAVPGYALSGGDDKLGYRFARRKLGAGLVTVVELDYLDNEGLRDPAARALAFQLLAPGLGQGRMQLVYSADVPSLFRLLVENAWMVLLPLVLALVAWLAWRNQRFGPLQPAPEPRRRALLEHVHAAGEFHWRRQRAPALHAAVLRLFRQRLQRRAPELDALDGEAQVLALAEATALPAAHVRQALRPQALNHPAHFTQSIATLLQMRSRL
jgi:hypothetical protein